MSLGVVYRKECLDNVRDRRTILASFSLAVLGPVFFVGVMVFVLERALGESNDAIEFSVVGADYAPQLMDYLRNQNTEIEELESDAPRDLVINGDQQLVLVINEDYAERYQKGSVNTLVLIHDSSQLSSTRRHLSILRSHINGYSRVVGLLRM